MTVERIKLSGDRELISGTIPQKDFVEEMNHRSWKAGHTTRFGECRDATKIMANGFGVSKLNVWPRDENGQLIE
jgi:hypothetical protein